MQPLFEHRLELAGYATRALELEGDGPPLVLLHGFGDSADTWRPLLALLGRRDRRALALDLPGFGAAAPLGDGPILPQLDAFAAAAVEHAADGGAEVVVAGNSLGGAVALRAGERDQLPIAGVVPIGPAGLEMPRWFGILERDPILRTLLDSPVPLPPRVVRAAVGEVYRQLAFARPRAVPAGVVRAFTDHHRDRRGVARLLDTGRRLLPELAAPFALERVACPVLLVWGERDRMVTHRGARLVTEALPDTTYALLDGIGHCPQVEAPERVADLLAEFPPRAARRRAA
jgi:pimeloyl-ACP methyl ester carboxylesterase